MLNTRQIKQFHRDGFIVVPSVLTKEQAAELRSFLIRVFDAGAKFEGDAPGTRYDVYSRYPELHWVLFHPPILSSLKSLLGDNFVYLPEMAAMDSSFGDWHKDTSTQEVEGYLYQYEPDYFIVEVGLYLQDNSEEYGGGLDVIPGSHICSPPDKYAQRRRPPKGALGRFWRDIKDKLRYEKIRIKETIGLNKEKLKPGQYSVPNNAGDLVIFDYKLDHKATWAKKKPIPEENRKIGLFFGCSVNDDYARRYSQFLASRPHYSFLKNHRYAEKLQELARENNVTLATGNVVNLGTNKETLVL